MKRVAYILKRLASDLVSLFSRALNAFLFGGSTAQTLSARAYIEGRTDAKWARRGRIINAVFFWEENHVKASWEQEVERARYTLERLRG